jgi:hypothetical protein
MKSLYNNNNKKCRDSGTVKVYSSIYNLQWKLTSMAKKDSSVFYLRKAVDTDGGTFASSDIDISAYIDTLKGNVLRVSKVWFEWTSDDGGPIETADVGADKTCSAVAQITTESQTGIQPLSNTSMVAKHQIYHTTDNTSGTNNFIMIHEDTAMNPADFDDGFLVANDTIQLGLSQSPSPHTYDNNIRCVIMLECEQVKMSASDAQAILLSQAIG